MNLKDMVEYRAFDFQIVICPICGFETLDRNWICECCGWEYDGKTKDDDYSSANGMTVKNYRDKYL